MSQRPGLTFSHVGFFVTDLERQADFYTRVLEFTETDRGLLEGPQGPMQLVFLSRDPDEHHQIVLISGRPAQVPFNVINQVSLKADSLATLQQFHGRLQEAGAAEILPVTHGNALSVYFRDPEGNRVELYVDTPWYVTQPCRVPAPIELPPDELMAWAERHARTLPGFRPRSEWRREMARRMGLES
ncbi:VOC family protein [Ramlibacter sp. MAHUQ-53]|uniref:VOC family protein n=1 Tax=unclassified Ramlibacter TaxID=2617605 RepID=UPI003629361D